MIARLTATLTRQYGDRYRVAMCTVCGCCCPTVDGLCLMCRRALVRYASDLYALVSTMAAEHPLSGVATGDLDRLSFMARSLVGQVLGTGCPTCGSVCPSGADDCGVCEGAIPCGQCQIRILDS